MWRFYFELTWLDSAGNLLYDDHGFIALDEDGFLLKILRWFSKYLKKWSVL